MPDIHHDAHVPKRVWRFRGVCLLRRSDAYPASGAVGQHIARTQEFQHFEERGWSDADVDHHGQFATFSGWLRVRGVGVQRRYRWWCFGRCAP